MIWPIRWSSQSPDGKMIFFDLLWYHFEFDPYTQVPEFWDIAYKANYLYQIGFWYLDSFGKDIIETINQHANICNIQPFHITSNPPSFLSWDNFDDITRIMYRIGFLKQAHYEHDIHASLIPTMTIDDYYKSLERMEKKWNICIDGNTFYIVNFIQALKKIHTKEKKNNTTSIQKSPAKKRPKRKLQAQKNKRKKK